MCATKFTLFLSLLIVLLSAPRNLFPQAGSGENDPRVERLYDEAHERQQQGDVPGAIEKYEEILKIAPKLGIAYNNAGALYFRQRNYAKAAAVLEQGLKVNPTMTSASALLGISLFQMADYAKARPHLEASLKANPHDGTAQMFLAKDLIKLGDNEGAAAQLHQLTAREPKNQEAFYLLARSYMELSEQALGKMTAIDPNSVLARQLSAEVMESMNNYDGAVVQLKKALEMAPNQPGNHYKLGDAYWSMSQFDLAAEQFHAELAVNPNDCQSQWKLGNIVLQKNGPPEEALADIDKALAACPTLTDAQADRGRVLLKLNRNEEALASLQAAEKASPDDPPIHFLLARVYRALGRTQEAGVEMQTFSRLDDAARAATAERASEVIKNKQSAH